MICVFDSNLPLLQVVNMAEQSDLGSPDRRPCFYKIIWLANCTDLLIPSDFKKHLMNERTDRVTLRTTIGSWDVKVLQDEEGGMCFVQGWKEFIKDHSLGKAEFLLFKYNGDMSFDVVIFNTDGCARNYVPDLSSHLQSVSSFTSPFPFFRSEIKDYNAGSNCTLPIPHAFSTRHLPMSKQIMILRDSEGKFYPVKVIVTSSGGLALREGWKAFSESNSIKKGDVCIFELIQKNVMQVHIFK